MVYICIALVISVLVAYMQTVNHQFISIDDPFCVSDNPHIASGITDKNIFWAFTSVNYFAWCPITWLSHMADIQVYGMNPRGHHLTNIFIHTLSVLLLFILLLRMTKELWQCAFVAALFALHPMHVESVAWVAERKDVLSAFFGLLTLLIYAEYITKRNPTLYILSVFSFILGLMSKPMIVVLPIVMLLIDFWPLDRYRHVEPETGLRQFLVRVTDLINEKIPYFVCSLLSGVITIYGYNKVVVLPGLNKTSFLLRFENISISYVKYIVKTIWPHDLAIFYPFPFSIPLWQVIGSLFVLLILSLAAIRARHQSPYLAVGWFWFLVTLTPVIGLSLVAMADRYSYIPSIGLFIIAAWGVPALTKRMRYQKGILTLLAAAVIISSFVLTYHQLSYWQDSIKLYRHTLQVTTNNSRINIALGDSLVSKGNYDAALQEYQVVLTRNPYDPEAHYSLGVAYYVYGDIDAAIQEFMETLSIRPDYEDTHNKLGVALARIGKINAAIQEFSSALRVNPDNADAGKNMTLALALKSKQNELRK